MRTSCQPFLPRDQTAEGLPGAKGTKTPGPSSRAPGEIRAILDGVKSDGKVILSRQAGAGCQPKWPDTSRLARLIAAYAPHDGSFDLRIPGLHASRFSRINKECVHALSVSSLCIVTQGAKTVIVGNEVFEYDASRMIVFSVALPVAAQVIEPASPSPTSP